jgi:hypothetical protein
MASRATFLPDPDGLGAYPLSAGVAEHSGQPSLGSVAAGSPVRANGAPHLWCSGVRLGRCGIAVAHGPASATEVGMEAIAQFAV